MMAALSDEEYRVTRRREWDEAGKRYDKLSVGALADLSRQAAEQLFKLVQLAAGEKVLDVGTGAGSPALEAAPYVGPGGRIVGIDSAPSMIGAARRRASELGIGNAEFFEMEGESLDFADGSFDAIISRYAYPHFTNASAAFRESFRVLRSGGRLAAAMHGAVELNPYICAPILALRKYHPDPAPLTDRGPFGLHTPQLLEAELRKAGFGDVKVHAYDTTIVVDDFNNYWAAQKAGGAAVRRALDAVPERHRDEAEKAALASMEAYVSGNRGEFPAQIVVGLGRRA
jgi:ubiquinone/menaquinone biosynthesis C-methylase UbiE